MNILHKIQGDLIDIYDGPLFNYFRLTVGNNSIAICVALSG